MSDKRTGGRAAADKRGMTFDIHQVLSVLPQRYPLVMIDRVLEVVPGKHLRALKCVSYGEPWVQGHFPMRPMLPLGHLVEALSQACTVLAYATEPFDPVRSLLYFLGVEKLKLRHAVSPGDALEIAAELVQHRSNIWHFAAEATVERTVVAEAELVASLVDHEP